MYSLIFSIKGWGLPEWCCKALAFCLLAKRFFVDVILAYFEKLSSWDLHTSFFFLGYAFHSIPCSVFLSFLIFDFSGDILRRNLSFSHVLKELFSLQLCNGNRR